LIIGQSITATESYSGNQKTGRNTFHQSRHKIIGKLRGHPVKRPQMTDRRPVAVAEKAKPMPPPWVGGAEKSGCFKGN